MEMNNNVPNENGSNLSEEQKVCIEKVNKGLVAYKEYKRKVAYMTLANSLMVFVGLWVDNLSLAASLFTLSVGTPVILIDLVNMMGLNIPRKIKDWLAIYRTMFRDVVNYVTPLNIILIMFGYRIHI